MKGSSTNAGLPLSGVTVRPLTQSTSFGDSARRFGCRAISSVARSFAHGSKTGNGARAPGKVWYDAGQGGSSSDRSGLRRSAQHGAARGKRLNGLDSIATNAVRSSSRQPSRAASSMAVDSPGCIHVCHCPRFRKDGGIERGKPCREKNAGSPGEPLPVPSHTTQASSSCHSPPTVTTAAVMANHAAISCTYVVRNINIPGLHVTYFHPRPGLKEIRILATDPLVRARVVESPLVVLGAQADEGPHTESCGETESRSPGTLTVCIYSEYQK